MKLMRSSARTRSLMSSNSSTTLPCRELTVTSQNCALGSFRITLPARCSSTIACRCCAERGGTTPRPAGRGVVPPRSAQHLQAIVDEHRAGKVILKLPNAQFCEVTVSSRQGKVVLLFEDISERVRAEERINFMAHYDALTGLPNRGYFADQVEADLRHRRAVDGTATSMLMIVDIDDFKHVNDTAGHLLGDRLLIESAERLNRTLGSFSLVARLGGDEFIVYRSGALS